MRKIGHGTTTIRSKRQRTPRVLRISSRKTRIPLRSNNVIDRRDAGTREDNNRALVRHEWNWSAWRRSVSAGRIWPRQGSGGLEKLPKRSSSGNKHAGHDGEKIRRKREKDGIIWEKKKKIRRRHSWVQDSKLTINSNVGTTRTNNISNKIRRNRDNETPEHRTEEAPKELFWKSA
jgi:hypothetical protein